MDHVVRSGWATSPRLKGSATAPSAWSSNVSFSDGSSFNFFRRERPELHFNAEGEPSFLVSGAMFGRDYPTRQYSFTMLQRVRGGGGDPRGG